MLFVSKAGAKVRTFSELAKYFFAFLAIFFIYVWLSVLCAGCVFGVKWWLGGGKRGCTGAVFLKFGGWGVWDFQGSLGDPGGGLGSPREAWVGKG